MKLAKLKVEKGVSVGKIIYDDLYLLHMNEELKDLSTPGPMVSFRSSRKINRYLVRATLHPVKMSVGSFSFNETDNFTVRLQEKLAKLIMN